MHRFAAPAAIASFLLCACGDPEPLPRQLPKAVRNPHAAGVQTWDVGDDLAARKKVIVDTCRQTGATEDRVALILSVFMGETVHGKCEERDATKDFSGLSKNYSAFNLNGDFLQCVGISGPAAERLNDDGNLAEATKAVIAGLDKYGDDKFLSFHRGGSQAREDLVSYGAAEYRAAMHAVQAFILADKSLMTSGKRAGLFIQHV